MSWFELNRKMLLLDGESIAESKHHHTKHYYNERFDDSILLNTLMIEDGSKEINYTQPYDVIETDHQHDSDLKTLYLRPDKRIIEGNYGLMDDRIWIVLSYIDNKEIYPKLHVQLCPYNLNWIDDQGEEYIYPCAIFNRISRYQEIDWRNRHMLMSDDVFEVRVQNNIYTQRIKHKQRFVLNNRVWEVQAIDNVSGVRYDKGVLFVIVKEAPRKSGEINFGNNTKEEWW